MIIYTYEYRWYHGTSSHRNGRFYHKNILYMYNLIIIIIQITRIEDRLSTLLNENIQNDFYCYDPAIFSEDFKEIGFLVFQT